MNVNCTRLGPHFPLINVICVEHSTEEGKKGRSDANTHSTFSLFRLFIFCCPFRSFQTVDEMENAIETKLSHSPVFCRQLIATLFPFSSHFFFFFFCFWFVVPGRTSNPQSNGYLVFFLSCCPTRECMPVMPGRSDTHCRFYWWPCRYCN